MRRLFVVASAAAALLPTTSMSAQLSRFRATWVRASSDRPAVIERLDIRPGDNGLRARVIEDCGDVDPARCTYEVPAEVYTSAPGVGPDSFATAITISYATPQWSRVAVFTWSQGTLVGDVYSSPTPPLKASSYVLHHVLLRASFAMPPPPAPPPAPPPTAMPQFPWPPPDATQREQLPPGLVTSGVGEPLGLAFDRIRRALDRGGVNGWSVYAIKDDGFAVVTRLEAIEADGTPKPGPQRWSGLDETRPAPTTVLDYINALFVARPGHYRIIVLAVTARPSFGGTGPLSADSAAKLVTHGADMLPEWLRRRTLATDGRCIALIYEFRRRSEGDNVKALTTSPVPVPRHLVLAGLWGEGDFRP